ncbi:MAG TPA: GGDEF domain-containing protein [Spirochaetota bacterium]|nr:GGDEF domain-containing protein [Spirochaetota bacterium]HPI88435.1 GGDEF domain-containing protein [Spirochaetota bacterium]HPR48798.1 GGDEF domain-containing protein [Spirochaetota bacterium]
MNYKQWIQKAPQSLKREEYRFYIFMNYAYIFALLVHILVLVPLYFMLTSPVAFVTDIVCVAIDIVAIIMIRRGAMKLSYFLFVSAVTVHTTVSIIFFGAGSFLPLYYITLLGLTFFSPWSLLRKMIAGLVFVGLAVGLTGYSVFYPPISEITKIQFLFWSCGNITVNSFGLAYGIYYFSFIVDAAEEKLRYQAEHDLLTGVLNRSAIIKVLVSTMVRSQNSSVAAIMGDIDHFKRINDTYGHLVGDEVLKIVTGLIGDSLREGDALGRFGGEEFIIVLPGCTLAPALRVAERVRTLLCSTPVKSSAGEITVTMSLGVAVMQNGQEGNVEALLLRADQALYSAKEKGRNRVEHA